MNAVTGTYIPIIRNMYISLFPLNLLLNAYADIAEIKSTNPVDTAATNIVFRKADNKP